MEQGSPLSPGEGVFTRSASDMVCPSVRPATLVQGLTGGACARPLGNAKRPEPVKVEAFLGMEISRCCEAYTMPINRVKCVKVGVSLSRLLLGLVLRVGEHRS